MEVKGRLMSNTVYLMISWVSSVFLNFFFQVVATKTLLPEELGILATAINFCVIIATLLTFGMEQTTQRLTSYYLGKNKSDFLKSVLWFFLTATIFFNVLTIIVLLVFSQQIAQLVKIPQGALFISIAALFPVSISIFLAGVIRGYQNMRYLIVTAILGDFIKLALSVTLVFLGYKLFGFLIAYLIAVSSVFLFRLPSIKIFITKFKRPNVKLIATQAVPSFITQILWMLIMNGQYLIISTLQTTYETGLFAVGMVLSNQIYFIPRIISDALFPITSRLTGDKSLIKQQRDLINHAVRYTLLIAFPLLSFIISFPKPLIFLIGRVQFFPAADLVPVLLFASLFFGLATLFSRTLYAVGRTITFQNISIVAAIFYLILSITLTILFSSLGTSLAYLATGVFMTALSLYYLKKHIGFNINFSPILKILASSIITYSTLYIISFITPNLIIGAILAGIFTLIYFVLLFVFNFYDTNDVKIFDFISNKIPFSRKYLSVIKSAIVKRIQKNGKSNEVE